MINSESKKKVEIFLDQIYISFSKYMYDLTWEVQLEPIEDELSEDAIEVHNLTYPFCCKYASIILSIFLSRTMHVDFNLFYLDDINHYFVKCEKLECIIDFVGFQFNHNFRRNEFNELSWNEIKSRISDYSYLYNLDNYPYYGVNKGNYIDLHLKNIQETDSYDLKQQDFFLFLDKYSIEIIKQYKANEYNY